MNVDFQDLTQGQIYHLMIQTIVPRPIAWVLSDSGGGSWNLAPFSYFNGISSAPPLCMLSIGHKKDGSRKDTWVNIDERQDFVVHISSSEHADSVTASSRSLDHGESEVELGGLQTVPFEGSRLPRLVGPRVAFACRKHRILELGEGPQGVVFGEIHAAWLDDSIVRQQDGRLRVDAVALDPLARLGGEEYASLGDVFVVKRPG